MTSNAAQHVQDHEPIHGQRLHRVRKRVSNACNRCRRQKIGCTGLQPCDQCTRRGQECYYDRPPRRLPVSRRNSEDRGGRTIVESSPREQAQRPPAPAPWTPSSPRNPRIRELTSAHTSVQRAEFHPDSIDRGSESDDESTHPGGTPVATQHLTNPLVHETRTYTTDTAGRPSYLGTSSNWSFGRRILITAHEKTHGTPLPAEGLLFEGSTYDLGWDGRRSFNETDQIALPAADYALFLINAVKFHCFQLFQLFQEDCFMQQFRVFYESANSVSVRMVSDLWYTHYLFVLAIGKALIVKIGKEKKPAGVEFFVQGMKKLPDMTFLCKEPLHAMEVLCCGALYLQCIDMRMAAYNLIGQAMRIAIAHGFHTDMRQDGQLSLNELERCREIFWTMYLLDCHLSSLMGSPLALPEREIGIRHPSYAASPQKSLALEIHIELASIIALTLGTIYSKDDQIGSQFLGSIKHVLRRLADINKKRTTAFPLYLSDPTKTISRLSAHLSLFHHQCIVVAIRPLLFSFWQKRLDTLVPERVSSSGEVRSLLRFCIGSARQNLKILTALQSQALLELFIPFDLEAAWSSAVVLLVIKVIDPSLLRNDTSFLKVAFSVLDEIAAGGNLVAQLRRNELQQLHANLEILEDPNFVQARSRSQFDVGAEDETVLQPDPATVTSESDMLTQWNFEEEINGAQLEALAESLDFTSLDWLSTYAFDPIGSE